MLVTHLKQLHLKKQSGSLRWEHQSLPVNVQTLGPVKHYIND